MKIKYLIKICFQGNRPPPPKVPIKQKPFIPSKKKAPKKESVKIRKINKISYLIILINFDLIASKVACA